MSLHRRNWLIALAAAWVGTFWRTQGRAEDAAAVPLDPILIADLPAGGPEAAPPLLVDAHGQPIETPAGWAAERARLKSRWLEFLGPAPKQTVAPAIETISMDQQAGFTRRTVRWEVEPGAWLDAHLLVPSQPAPPGGYPAVLALHQTSNRTIDEIAGVGEAGDQARGVDLVRAGFVVFCPKNFLWQDAPSYAAAVERLRARHPEMRGMHKMLFDARTSVDAMLRLAPDVNPDRIGAFGHSLGAKEVVYLMAFDERIRSGVASDGGVGFAQTNWDAPWYLGPDGPTQATARKLAPQQLLALVAPRSLLIVAGGRERGGADGAETEPFIRSARRVYRLVAGRGALGFWNHGLGHSLADPVFAKCLDWLKRTV
jgi:dienelactone hydrolase